MSTIFITVLYLLQTRSYCQEWLSEVEIELLTDIHYHFCTPDTFRSSVPVESKHKCPPVYPEYDENSRWERDAYEGNHDIERAEHLSSEKNYGKERYHRDVEDWKMEHLENEGTEFADSILERYREVEIPDTSIICCEPCSCNTSSCSGNNNCCPEILFHAKEVPPTIFECIRPELKPQSKYYSGSDVAYNMITSCASTPINSSYSDRCKNSFKYNDLYSKIPVLNAATNTTYQNRYCAYCNGLSDKDINYWKTQVVCDSGQLITRSLETVVDDIMLSDTCNLVFKPFPEKTATKCHFIPISRCNVTGKWATYNRVIERACGAYTAIFQNAYKNVFCYLCNEILPLKKLGCRLTPVINISFTVFLNIENEISSDTSNNDLGLNGIQHNTCTKDRLYDPVQGKCVNLVCRGFKSFIGGKCVNIVDKIAGVEYDVFFKITSLQSLSGEHVTEVIEKLKETFVSFFENENIKSFIINFFLKQSETHSFNLKYSNTTVDFIVLYIQFYIPVFAPVDISVIESIYNYHDSILHVQSKTQQKEFELSVEIDLFKTEIDDHNSSSIVLSLIDHKDNVSLTEFAQNDEENDLTERPANILLPTQNCMLVTINASFYHLLHYPWGIFIQELNREFKKSEYIEESGGKYTENNIQTEPHLLICRDKIQPLFEAFENDLSNKSGFKMPHLHTNFFFLLSMFIATI